MSDMATVAANALQSYQAALSTVSNNIANATTVGYSEQQVQMVEGTPTPSGNVDLGTGAVAATVTRNYSSFANNNVRTSASQLASQTSLLTYSNAVVNALGNSTSGLTASMDGFFNSLNQLSTNPASSVLRTGVLGSAKALTSTFSEIQGQLHQVDTQTQTQAQSDVTQINTLAGQLAVVNSHISQNATLSAQPPALLDQRDTLLNQLSKIAGINVTFSANGAASVSIDGAGNAGNIVVGQNANPMNVSFDSSVPPVMTLSTTQNGAQYKITGISSGDLSGIQSFRNQVLEPAMSQMSSLAQTLATQVNQSQAQGIDLNGNLGQNLFTFNASAQTPADGIQVAITDPNLIAAAGPFNVQASSSNSGTATPSVTYQAPSSVVPPALAQVLGNNSNMAVGTQVSVGQSAVAAVTTIPAGTQDATIYLDPQSGQTLANMQLQVLTRSGQQVLGSSLSTAQQSQLLTTTNGFNLGSTYNTQYLNQSGSAANGSAIGYRGMTVFYGAQAQPSNKNTLTSAGTLSAAAVAPATMTGTNVSLGSSGSLPAGSFTLNGIAMPTIPAGSSAVQIANIINQVTAQSGVEASASTSVSLPIGQLSLTSGLSLDGTNITPIGGGSSFTSASDLAQAINAKTTTTGISASISGNGSSLVLNDPSGKSIDVNSSAGASAYLPNALGLPSGSSQAGQLTLTSTTTSQPVQLGFGATQVATTSYSSPTTPVNSGAAFNLQVTAGSPPLTSTLSVPAGQDTPQGIASLLTSSNLGISANVVPQLNSDGSTSYQLQLSSATNTPFSVTAASQNNGPVPSLGFSSPGNPASLASLGFRTAAYISGKTPDDLVVAVSGTGNVSLAATESGAATNDINDLRNVPKQINFFDTTETSNELPISGLNAGAAFNLTVNVGYPSTVKTVAVPAGQDSPTGIANALNAANLGFTATVSPSATGNGNQVIHLSSNATAPQSPQPFSVSLASSNATLTNGQQLNFSSDPSAPLGYNIIDNNDGTNLGGGILSSANNAANIQYDGVTVGFSGVPLSGDSFTLTGDQGRSGNNQNAVAMTKLSTAQVVGGKQTLNGAYSNFVDSVGNTANQATIAQTALTVVNNQAITTQSQISGVSLDTEAANLIKFQQGYQAAAKTIQVASQLFTDIFNIN